MTDVPFDSMKTFLTRLYELLRGSARDGELSAEEFDAAVKQARSHAGGKAKAIRQQMAEERQHDGFLVALWLDSDTASALTLASPDAEAPGSLHITLCYCGDVAALGELAIARALVGLSGMVTRHVPLSGTVGGIGRFAASRASDDQDVIYAVPDVPGLAELRDDVAECLQAAGCAPKAEHGWTPHITLVYVDADTPTPELPPALPLRFDRLTIAIGERRVELPLTGQLGSYPMSELADIAADGQEWRLFNEYLFAEAPDWIPYLPRPGTYKHPRYGEIGITPERNGRFVSNFKKKVYQDRLPLDAEHETKLSGAVGWIVGMRQNEDGSVDANVEWTDRGKGLIKADRFKYFSPEWYDKWEQPDTGKVYEDVAIGGALCTRPFFKNPALRPLVASERGLEVLEAHESDRQADTGGEMADKIEGTEQGFTELQAKAEAQAEQIAALQASELAAKATAEKVATELKQANERIAAMEQEARRKRFNQMAATWPEPAQQVAILETLADTVGESHQTFTEYVRLQNAQATQLRDAGLFREIGSDASGAAGKGAWQRIEEKARSLVAAEPGLTLAVATERVLAEDKDLATAYVAERRG